MDTCLSSGRDVLAQFEIGLTQIQMYLMLHIVQHLADTVHAHDDHYEINTLQQFGGIAETGVAGDEVAAYKADHKADDCHQQGFDNGVTSQQRDGAQAHQQQHEVLGGAEVDDQIGNGRRQKHQHGNAEETSEERTDGGNAQRESAPSLLHQRITVHAGDDGRRIARSIDQDGGDPPAEHAAHIDAHQQRQTGGGVHGKGQRDHQRQTGRGAQAGQCADDGAHHGAQQNDQQIIRGKHYQATAP